MRTLPPWYSALGTCPSSHGSHHSRSAWSRVIAYNALGGLAFGWLYWKRGLEHAMLAHPFADHVLHVAASLFGACAATQPKYRRA